MTHQFNVGDIVRIRNTTEMLKVIGFLPKDERLLHCRWVRDDIEAYVPAESVMLVAPHRQAESDHPGKIETDAKARDVTTTWDGGYKIHEPRKIET